MTFIKEELRLVKVNINQLIEKSLNSKVDNYKKDIFDQTIEALINKFEEMIESNNELMVYFARIEEGDIEDE